MATSEVTANSMAGCCPSESLFERYSWFYAFCREHLFCDHSEVISRCLWDDEPPATSHLVEVGCGPGFYACRFAERFPQIRISGIDLSKPLLTRARDRASRKNLGNCSFHHADVHSLPAWVEPVDAIIISRLFLIVPNREDVMRELFRVLRPGGRVFIAEPVSALRTQIPLYAMWLLAKLTSFSRVPYIEPHRVKTMSETEFEQLIRTAPWGSVRIERNGRYQLAVCEKRKEAIAMELAVA